MSSGRIDEEALRELYQILTMCYFIKNPVTMEKPIRRVNAELE
jgi:hypothetical protein